MYVQKHSSRDEIIVATGSLALVKTVKVASHEDSAWFNTSGDKEELSQQGLKLFSGEEVSCSPGGEFG